MAITLNTGREAFDIILDNGEEQETVTIYFNPNDPDLSIRMRDFQKKVDERSKDIEDVELDENGKPTDVSAIDNFEKIQKILFEELDKAFNSKISDKIFRQCSPFAITGGTYFVLQFIESITPEIEKRRKKANDRVQKTIDKYKKKYGK